MHIPIQVLNRNKQSCRFLIFTIQAVAVLLTKMVFKHRDQLGVILQKIGFTVGAELGVQQGLFTETTLKQWHGAKTYVLVDVWSEQDKYSDTANVNNEKQNN